MKIPKYKFVDLSTPVKNPVSGEMNEENAGRAPQIDYRDHKRMLPVATSLLGCTKEDFPGENAWANEVITLSSHHGTHMDAPYHYYPTSNGEPAPTITELPLDMFFGHAVVLDLQHISENELVREDDIKMALAKINYTLQEGDIVCLYYGTDRKLGTPEYWTRFPGMSSEATEYILDFGVRVMGTDAMGFDLPFEQIRENFQRDRDKSKLWEAHRVGARRPYSHIEKLANLGAMPPTGALIACFPVHIYKASAGWCRCVGMVPEDE